MMKNTSKNYCISILFGHVGEVWRLAILQNSKMFISGSGDFIIKMWLIGKRKVIRTFIDNSSLRSLSISQDINYFFSTSCDQSIKIWNI